MAKVVSWLKVENWWCMVKVGLKSRIGGNWGGTWLKFIIGGAWLKLKVFLKSRIGGSWHTVLVEQFF